MTCCNRMGEIEYDLPKTKFISLIKFVVALRKVFKTVYLFSRLYLRFPDFSQVWKIAGQISRFYGPCKCGMHYTTHFCAWPHSSNTVLQGFGALIYSLFKRKVGVQCYPCICLQKKYLPVPEHPPYQQETGNTG